MDDRVDYEETISSPRTQALFLVLTGLFALLGTLRLRMSGWGLLAVLFVLLFALFLFYSINYRRLTISMNRQALTLRFGLFSWTVPWANVGRAFVDDTSLWRISGAGIHFTFIDRRYRMYWNFLHFPRVVIALKKPSGVVRELAFTTRRPAEVLDAIGRFTDRPQSPADGDAK